MEKEPENSTIWHGLLYGEFFSVLVALATTILPTRSGSRYGIAGHFVDEPTFLQEFLVNLVFVNGVLIILALGLVVWVRIAGSDP